MQKKTEFSCGVWLHIFPGVILRKANIVCEMDKDSVNKDVHQLLANGYNTEFTGVLSC